MEHGRDTPDLSTGDHFSCALSAALLAVMRGDGGDPAVQRLLDESGCTRSVEYLQTTGNWLSFQEAMALLDAASAITGDPLLARRVGEQAIPVATGSPVAAMLRALGSPEEAYRRIPATTAKMGQTSISEAVKVDEGYAELRFGPRPGYPRTRQQCEWTRGLLTQPPLAFGLPPAIVEHDECTAEGAPACVYRVRWSRAQEDAAADASWEVTSLRKQLKAMSERLDSLFATAADLIGSSELDVTLARITERAAHELRNPRCVLAVRPLADGDVKVHDRGLGPAEAARVADSVLGEDAPPASWLVAPVRSHRRDYGRLVAIYDSETQFFPQERRLIEVFASYAATALDSATALHEANLRHQQTGALLQLARALASAASSREIARRLADAVPNVVDCDRVSVYVWEEATGQLVRAANRNGLAPAEQGEMAFTPDQVKLLRTYLERPSSEPSFVDARTGAGDRDIARILSAGGAAAAVVMPISTRERFLGALVVSVDDRPERLEPTPQLLDRLSGVAAHATTALENGRLVDQITHQASHDGLTGLANRRHFHDRLTALTADVRDEAVTIFYIDLDGFKPINDRLGHAAGDELLRQTASRLTQCVRGSDVVARLGGDEFAVLAHDLSDGHDCDGLATRLARAFERPFRIAGQHLQLTASIGRATWPADGDDLESLVQRADDAMYAVKRGRGRLAAA